MKITIECKFGEYPFIMTESDATFTTKKRTSNILEPREPPYLEDLTEKENEQLIERKNEHSFSN